MTPRCFGNGVVNRINRHRLPINWLGCDDVFQVGLFLHSG